MIVHTGAKQAMKLYDIVFSPFSARVRIVIRLKQLAIDIVPPPLALKSAEFKAHHPLGKIPILELDDGSCIAESWVIMEYLEDIFATLPLRPAGACACAHMRVKGRVADLFVGPALFPLFGELSSAGAGDADKTETAVKVQRQLVATEAEVVKLGRVLDEATPLGERPLDLGDIALVTTLYYVDAIPPLFGAVSPIAQNESVSHWWDTIGKIPVVNQTLTEINGGFRGFLKQIGRN